MPLGEKFDLKICLDKYFILTPINSRRIKHYPLHHAIEKLAEIGDNFPQFEVIRKV